MIVEYIQSALLLIAAFLVIVSAVGFISLSKDMKNVVYARIHIVDIETPIDEVVEILNKLNPVCIGGFVSYFDLLIDEVKKGKLNINPLYITTVGYPVTCPHKSPCVVQSTSATVNSGNSVSATFANFSYKSLRLTASCSALSVAYSSIRMSCQRLKSCG